VKRAIIIGASSGVGAALAWELDQAGWRVGLLARRVDALNAVAAPLSKPLTDACDVTRPAEAVSAFNRMVMTMGGVDLVVIAAGVGDLNPALDWRVEKAMIDTNVVGFAALADAAFHQFTEHQTGHLVGITSIMALRGSGAAAAYAASKAFQSVYLDGLRALARSNKWAVTITEAQPGFVDTAMMKADKPFWVASPQSAARQIRQAIEQKRSHVYVTPRWRLIGWLFKLLPRPGTRRWLKI
jgi:short-subunit dehydrogenase